MMINPEVKICGITNFEDAFFCRLNKIDCLGFVFFEKSKRFITPKNVGKITEKLENISFAGVFVDSSMDFVLEAVELGNLDFIQLHGKESIDYIETLQKKTKAKIIKCLYINDEPNVEKIEEYKSLTHGFIVEAQKNILPGGNGIDWDYSKVFEFSKKYKIISAGGINPSNFEKALKLSGATAFDMSSGVEISPGIKDHKKIKQIADLKNKIKIKNNYGRIF
ncbi:MAG: phosphoribosylanthranilate isomerase [Desulforegulaceae bacterium]|nr:phosphoribosylanthranilate isomerase [Desulforegulaceae bacterium]